MFNQVTLLGNLVKKPELRTTPNGKEVANAVLATNKKFKNSAGEMQEDAEFHNLVIWNNASAFTKYLDKGSKVFLTGELKTRNWEKQDGSKAYMTEIIVKEFKFLEKIDSTKKETVEESIDIPVENIPF